MISTMPWIMLPSSTSCQPTKCETPACLKVIPLWNFADTLIVNQHADTQTQEWS